MKTRNLRRATFLPFRSVPTDKVLVREHAVMRFRERVAPEMPVEAARDMLRHLLMTGTEIRTDDEGQHIIARYGRKRVVMIVRDRMLRTCWVDAPAA